MLFNRAMKYSYATQRKQRHYILSILVWVFAVFLLYSVVSTCLVSTVVVDNSSMAPGLAKGDRLLVSKLGLDSILPFMRSKSPEVSLINRGDVVLVSLEDISVHRSSVFVRFGTSILRFFSAQRFGDGNSALRLKRLIAVPGDELSMGAFIFRIRPASGSYALTEFELCKRPYDLVIPKAPSGWTNEYLLSSSMDASLLGNGRYFFASDDRSNSSDSRTWGSLPVESIRGKVVFRYWPIGRFGRP